MFKIWWVIRTTAQKQKKTHVSNWNTLENYEPRILAWSLSKSKNSHVTNDKKVFFKASCHEIFKSNKLLFRFWSHICLQKSSHPIDTYRSVFYRIWCPKYHNSNFRGSNPDKSTKIGKIWTCATLLFCLFQWKEVDSRIYGAVNMHNWSPPHQGSDP